MGVYDVMMLVIVVAAVMWGAFKGLAWQIASLAAITVSYLVAVNFRGSVAQHIDAEPPWNTFAAMLILYLGTSLVIWILFRMVRGSIEGLKLGSFDRQLGAVFGGLKGVAIATVVTFFGLTLLTQNQQEAIIHSRSGHYIAKVLDGARMIMPDELHAVLGPYMDQMDRKLDHVNHVHPPGGFSTSPNMAMDPHRQGTLDGYTQPLQGTQPLPGSQAGQGGQNWTDSEDWTTLPSNPQYAQPTYSSPPQGHSQPTYSPPTYSPPTYSQPAYSPPAQPYGQPVYSPRSAQPQYHRPPY